MRPFMAIIGTLQSKSTTLADCYHEVVSLAAVTDGISTNSSNFKDHCAAVFGKTWTDINGEWYVHIAMILAYQLLPGLRGKGIVASIFLRIAQTAAAMWKNLDNGKSTCNATDVTADEVRTWPVSLRLAVWWIIHVAMLVVDASSWHQMY